MGTLITDPVPEVVIVVCASRTTSRDPGCAIVYALLPGFFTPGVAPLTAKVGFPLAADLALPLAHWLLCARASRAISDILPLPCARRLLSAAKLESFLLICFPALITIAPPERLSRVPCPRPKNPASGGPYWSWASWPCSSSRPRDAAS